MFAINMPPAGSRSPVPLLTLSALLLSFTVYILNTMWTSRSITIPLAALISASTAAVDLKWYPPASTQINNLSSAINDTGAYGYIFNTSVTPDNEYGTYNWCNMPHVRKTEYVTPSSEYKLRYVEVIHRHHKRTPYAANSFPVESYPWNCPDSHLFYYADSPSHTPAQVYWQGYSSPINPFSSSAPGFQGTCQFPQITGGGLDDSFQHGQDLWGVYGDLLGFLPTRGSAGWEEKVRYRVTTNQITSQVVGMVINGMYGLDTPIGVEVQLGGVDSLEPAYSCPAAAAGYDSVKSLKNAVWKGHLDAARGLYEELDDISGVPENDAGFHLWMDHYYDNLSARECHAKPLPCKLVGGRNSSTCVDREMADSVYRLGQWEYSRLYRDEEAGFKASVASMGVWIAEVSRHLRDVVEGKGGEVVYRHNVAHDGSLSRVLSVLQVEQMVWPGMGSEVVFELYEKVVRGETDCGKWFVRVLFGGRTLTSSNPSLGKMDMVPVKTLLGYFDGLAGVDAALVAAKCNGTIAA